MKPSDSYKYFLNGFNPGTDALAKSALQDVQDSGLSPDVLERAQVRIFGEKGDVLKKRLGFARIDGQPILNTYRLIEIPYFDDGGKVTRYEFKPFPSLYFKGDDKPRKYLQAKDQAPTPYILPEVWTAKDKTNQVIWITEGVKKVLSLVQHGRHAIGLSGVWNFKAGRDRAGDAKDSSLWQQLEVFHWKGRTVYIGFDSDLWTNPGVRHALYELSFKLYALGAIIKLPLWADEKGIDDRLAAHVDPAAALKNIEDAARPLDTFLTFEHQEEILRAATMTVRGMEALLKGNLIAMIAKAFKRKPKEIEAVINERIRKEFANSINNLVDAYFIDADGYLCRWKEKRDGISSSLRIANFKARIVEEITEDNGQEITKKFAIEGAAKDKALPQAIVPTSQFAGLNWVLDKWGNDAIIEPAQNTKDCLRHFIQVYSNLAAISHRTVYTHTGWRKVGDSWVYLMANGALGGNGVSVDLPGEFLIMDRYCLPATPENEVEAIRTSLSFLHLGKAEITFPAYSYLFLSPLTSLLDPTPNFSAYFVGETGTLKSTVATLLLSHFGNFSIRSLSNFDSTANQIEKRAFVLKDTLQVLDDYFPSARQKEALQKEAIAQRLIRAYSNRSGRERLNPDATEKGKYVPRGLLLITGEEMVQLQSTLARIMVCEFNHGDIDPAKLTDLQARAGVLPHAMASYILWIQNNMEVIKASFSAAFPKLRGRVIVENAHKKIPEQIAYLQFSLDTLLTWAHEKGAIDESERKAASAYGWSVICNVGQKHSERIAQDDPVTLFFDVIGSLLVQGKVRIDHREGGYAESEGGNSGELIGYHDENFYYLLPTSTWHVLNAYLRLEGGYFPFAKNTLYDVLEKRGYLICRDGKHTISIRIKGKVMKIIKILKKSGIFGDREGRVSEDEAD